MSVLEPAECETLNEFEHDFNVIAPVLLQRRSKMKWLIQPEHVVAFTFFFETFECEL